MTLEVTELLSKGAIVETQLTPHSYIPSGEEGWWAEASNQPERPQPVCEGRTLRAFISSQISYNQGTGW